jgi:uncharacterized membrane protein YkoI
MKRTLPALIALLAATLAASGVAMADPAPDREHASNATTHQPNSLGADWRLQQDEVRQGVRQRRLMPLSGVIAQINARSPGRQLDAGLEYQGDRPIYRVRWMTKDGRRVDYLIDATTGAILSGG